MRILVVEDDNLVADGLRQGLERAGYAVDVLNTAVAAAEALRVEAFDAAIVDLGLPDMDGLQLIGRLRQRGTTLPILILTARDTLDACVAGLDSGADDYLAKPFRTPEVLARLRVLIRRSHSRSASQLSAGPLALDLGKRTAALHGVSLDLPAREWSLLEALLLASPNVVNKDKLLQSLGGWQSEMTANAIEVYVSRLRQKLGPAGLNIRTVRGIGYRLDEPDFS
jgi:DNA-binding response OmpR family regulator